MSTSADRVPNTGPFAVLVGKTITGAYLSEIADSLYAETHVVISTADGLYVFGAQGDCCANAYFAGATGTEALRGEVLATEQSDGPTETAEYGDETDHCFHAITTARGRCTIELRAEHNGYYSGWADYRAGAEERLGPLRPLEDFAQ